MQTETHDVIEGRYEVRGEAETRNGVELCEAYDRQLDRPVLIQRLTPDASADTGRRTHFLRSQQLAASVHNCPILSVYDAGVDAGRPFSVMEKRKDGSPADLARPGYPPNVPAALKVTRQAAEALRCCRESGLVDWTFSPDAVCVDGDGNAHLAVIEGLDGQHSSAKPSTDARALGAMLMLALFGRVDAPIAPAELAMLPPAVRELLGRLTGSHPATLWTAGDVEQAVAGIVSASYQPTQAYMPVVAADASADPMPARKPVSAHDAPTLAAPVAPVGALAPPYTESRQAHTQDDPKTQALGVVPYDTPPRGEPRQIAAPDHLEKRFLALGVIVALLLLLVVLGPRLLTRGAATPAKAAGVPSSQNIGAPVLVGKTLDEARNAAGAAGVNLAVGDPVHDAVVPPDRVSGQVPAPSASVQAGGLITVSLSLGPEEPTPVPAQSQPSQVQPAQEQAPSSSAPAPKVAPGQQKKDQGKKGKDH